MPEKRVHLAGIIIGAVIACTCSCIPCGFGLLTISVHGRLLDSDSGSSIVGAVVGGRISSEGEWIDGRAPYTTGGEIQGAVSSGEGEFDLGFSTPFTGCVLGRIDPNAPRHFPDPDRVELIINRNGCEQRITVDVNEDTVVDLSFPDDTLELKDPILLPPCEDNTP